MIRHRIALLGRFLPRLWAAYGWPFFYVSMGRMHQNLELRQTQAFLGQKNGSARPLSARRLERARPAVHASTGASYPRSLARISLPRTRLSMVLGFSTAPRCRLGLIIRRMRDGRQSGGLVAERAMRRCVSQTQLTYSPRMGDLYLAGDVCSNEVAQMSKSQDAIKHAISDAVYSHFGDGTVARIDISFDDDDFEANVVNVTIVLNRLVHKDQIAGFSLKLRNVLDKLHSEWFPLVSLVAKNEYERRRAN
jgi:hypothetical protein